MNKTDKALQWLYEKKKYMEAKLEFTALHLKKLNAEITKLEKEKEES